MTAIACFGSDTVQPSPDATAQLVTSDLTRLHLANGLLAAQQAREPNAASGDGFSN